MSRRYDSKTNTFNQDGRLKQVEYAIEGINRCGSAIGIHTKEGVILATEKQDVSFLLEQNTESERIYTLDNHVYCIVSGHAADANFLINKATEASQEYRETYQESQPVEQLITQICDIKQYYTQEGGQRPFGVAFLIAGYDKHFGYQLYSTDPSGNYSGWKATSIGNKNSSAQSVLRQEYKEDINLEQGIDLAIKSLVKIMDTASPSPNKIEILVLRQDPVTKKVQGKQKSEAEISELLTKNGFNQQIQQEQ